MTLNEILNAEVLCLPAARTPDGERPAYKISEATIHDDREPLPVAEVVPHGPCPARSCRNGTHGEQHGPARTGILVCSDRREWRAVAGLCRRILLLPGILVCRGWRSRDGASRFLAFDNRQIGAAGFTQRAGMLVWIAGISVCGDPDWGSSGRNRIRNLPSLSTGILVIKL